jgi:hypothetical protein
VNGLELLYFDALAALTNWLVDVLHSDSQSGVVDPAVITIF